ncbi:glycerol-3-phosphate 1-O-acyltransferase PlsY [Betaproteobacteria bacterium]|nr:glycerol-3-phosphate 1-O-acyltransferase PlsY [Betaproteobacteria bacterium]
MFCSVAYLIGSISFAIIVSNFRGIADPRDYGSKNPGATNVFRSGDRLAGLLAFLGDFAKGYLSVALANLVSQILLGNQSSVTVITVLVSLAVILGHIYPVFYDFKGGKGVATTFGVLLATSFTLGGLASLVWVITFLITKISGFAAISTALTLPAISFFVIKLEHLQEFWVIFGMICIISTLLLFRHSANILALWRGLKKNEN